MKKLLILFVSLFAILSNSLAKDTLINVDRYEWMVQTSPSMNHYMRSYFREFRDNNLTAFIHIDILETQYDEAEDKPPYQFQTKEGAVDAKFLQGHVSFGGAPFFFIYSGIEVSKARVAADYDTKEYALASYQEFGYLNILGSVVYKTQPKFEEFEGQRYFSTSQDATETSTSINFIGSIKFLESALFYDSQNGLEKLYLSLKQDTSIGSFELRALDGYLPYDYQDLFFEYTLEKKRDYRIRMASTYRKKETSDFVNTEVELHKSFYNGMFNSSISYSYNKEFTPKPLHGYKAYFDFFEVFFMSWSKNYSQDLQRLPLEDATLFSIGLNFSFRN